MNKLRGQPRYSAFLRYTHWLTFALVALAYATINARKLLDRGSDARLFAVESHFLLGSLVLLISIPRIWLRLRSTRPPIVPPLDWGSTIAAMTAHIALFLFLVVQAVLGIGLPMTTWAIASFFGARPQLAELMESGHVWIGAAFYYVICIHIAAVVWHWLVRRDNTMQQML